MVKPVKIFLLALGVLIGSVLLTIGLFLAIDINVYKSEIESVVEAQTGRKMHIEGELHRSLFPWLGVKLGAIQLDNAAGFGDAPFARITGADVKVEVMPLFIGQLVVDTLTLNGLVLNLSRNREGKTNWDDLIAKQQDQTTPAPTTAPSSKSSQKPPSAEIDMKKLAAFTLGGIKIKDAQLSWRDASVNQAFVVDQLNMVTSTISIGKPLQYELALHFSSTAPKLNAQLSNQGVISADIRAQVFRLEKFKLDLNASGDDLPGGKIDSSIASVVEYNDKSHMLKVDTLTLETLGIKVQVNAHASQLNTDPQFQAEIAIAAFNPRTLLKAMGISDVNTTSPEVLGSAKLAAKISGNTHQIALSDLNVQADKTTLKGQASVKNFTQPEIQWRMNIDRLNVDEYLPPPTNDTTAAAPDKAPIAATTSPAKQSEKQPEEAPLAALTKLTMDGALEIKDLIVANAKLQNIEAIVKAKQGIVSVNPLNVSLYDGSNSADIALDVRPKIPKLTIANQVKSVAVGPLLRDVYGDDVVSGVANANFKINAQGVDSAAVMQSLNGTGDVALNDGVVKIDFEKFFTDTYEKYKKLAKNPRQELKKTAFEKITASFTIVNGVLNNPDLNAKLRRYRITGQGKVNLPQQSIDYVANATVLQSSDANKDAPITELAGHTIPITVSGALSDPQIKADYQSLLKDEAKKALKKQQDKLDEKTQQLIDEKKEEFQQKKEKELDKLKEKFKKLF